MRAFGHLLAAQARRDRWLLPIWILGIGLLGGAIGTAISGQFADVAERASIAALASANPAFLFLRGLPDGLSIGALAFFQSFSFIGVLAGFMSTFLVVRHTRADEELGRAELVGSTPIRRSTALAATIALGVIANLLLIVVVAVGYIVGGLPAGGSITAALAVGSVGLFFVGATAVVVQFLPSGRASNGVAAALVGAAYLIRGIGDALGTPNAQLTRVTPSGLSWLSPIGWGQATRPFSEPTLAPLVLSSAGFGLLAIAALTLRSRRDLGASLVPERRGRPGARLGGRSVLGLAWRLQRSTLLGWCIGVAVLGSIAGGLGPVVAEAVEGNPSLSNLIANLVPGTTADVVHIFTSALLGIGGVLAGAAGVQAVLRLRAEEAEGRAELLLATPVSRPRWVGATLVVATGSVLAVCTVIGTVTGIAIANSSGDVAAVARFSGAALAHTPAALVFVAITALVFAIVPRLTIPLGWGLLVIGLVLGQFGALLQLPEWLQNISPFHHSSALPVEDLNVAAASVLLATAVLGAALAMVLIRRRDLVS
ncbi:polyketide antibiotic transporter [Salinibacterium sp. ZJ454]|uniref:ABC transporter permease n=1 Tax=Salinibacterium sp. ZJ454 TaxID=2708339 RepID=UPI00141E797A|nr:polyketide antibiotic transporter [Salinibacterium sp. ZJ454]